MAKDSELQGGLFAFDDDREDSGRKLFSEKKSPFKAVSSRHDFISPNLKAASGQSAATLKNEPNKANDRQESELSEEMRAMPLSARMRPRTLDEYVGQEHLVGPGRILRRLMDGEALPSMILWGPPGTGKTSLARLLTAGAKAAFVSLSAVTAGVGEVRRIIGEARERWRLMRRRTLVFLDEIHRFNKAQQDVMLPHVEDGSIILVGATTENPSFQVVAPLLSRCRVFTLNPLSQQNIVLLLRRALEDKERGLGHFNVEVDPRLLDILAEACTGDARTALNILEEAVNSAAADEDGRIMLTERHLAEAAGLSNFRHSRSGESHYDIISALIKSVRGSDPDGAVYWLARLLEAGEDPLFVARRLVILASEDVGLADSNGLTVAVAAQQAVNFVGMPEGFYPLAHATLYLALAPKSNSVGTAYMAASQIVHQSPGEPVPLHLRNAPTKLMQNLGYAKGYRYAHDYENHYVKQQFLPDNLKECRFYNPGKLGYEKRLAAWLEHLRSSSELTREDNPA
ncbi:MAG: replication-associated recombination protein A [Candidatus Bruticola sp.]